MATVSVAYRESLTAPQDSFQKQQNPHDFTAGPRKKTVEQPKGQSQSCYRRTILRQQGTLVRAKPGLTQQAECRLGIPAWQALNSSPLNEAVGKLQPAVVSLTWRLLAFAEPGRPECSGGEKNGMGSEVHHIWLSRCVPHPK